MSREIFENNEYTRSKKVWCERNVFNERLLRISRWVAIIAALCTLLSISLLIGASNKYRKVPYIIETLDGKAVETYFPASDAKPLPVDAVENEIKAYVRALRENPADTSIKGRGLSKLNAMSLHGTQAYDLALSYYQEYIERFQETGGLSGNVVRLEFLESREIQPEVWLLRWVEWPAGNPDEKGEYSATLSYIQRPVDVANIYSNPFGIYVINLDIGERE